MTEPQVGCALDVETFTVILVGKNLIGDLMRPFTEALNKNAMATYNQIALAIVRIHGKAFGIDPENIPEPERWSLGTITKEDSDYMRSFLSVKEIMRSEIVTSTIKKDIVANKE